MLKSAVTFTSETVTKKVCLLSLACLRKYSAKSSCIIPEINFYLDTTLDDVEKIEKELKGEGDNPIL